jgi:hypothetical protein
MSVEACASTLAKEVEGLDDRGAVTERQREWLLIVVAAVLAECPGLPVPKWRVFENDECCGAFHGLLSAVWDFMEVTIKDNTSECVMYVVAPPQPLRVRKTSVDGDRVPLLVAEDVCAAAKLLGVANCL